MARLVVINKSLASSAHELGGSWTTIGRADGNGFQIVEGSVSGRHCEVRVQGEELQVRDLISTNGTFIAGQKISEGVVKPGQILRLGDVELKFEAATTPGTAFNSKMLATNVAAAKAAPAPTPAPPPMVPAKEPVAVLAEGEVEKKFQVLFVDDSMAFLELFGGLCAEFSKGSWLIHTATSADRALAVLAEHPMDLVVLDIGMPLLDGLQLLGLINRRYPGLKIAVMTGSATEGKRADALANGAELFLEKPMTADGIRGVFNVFSDLIAWHREGFTGALRHVGLTEVIQMECNGRHSSILEIRNNDLRGQIFIEAGVITHAAVGALAGEQAFYRLLSLKGGEFQVKPFKAPPQRTIESRWEFLLMDAARASDEETGAIKKSDVAATASAGDAKE
jgi:CheY-like chemotaxis protein